MAVGTILCLNAPNILMGMFTENEHTIGEGAHALKLISAGFIISSFSVTVSGVLEGIGKGRQSLIISLCRYMIIILPAAFILSRFMGPSGVWCAFGVTELITAAVAFKLKPF